jgi:hypothetical protein
MPWVSRSQEYTAFLVYVGQMGHSIMMRCKEHAQHMRLYQLDKLVVTKHGINEGHHITFKETMVLAKMVGCMDSTVKEAIEIGLHPNNFNRNTRFTLN